MAKNNKKFKLIIDTDPGIDDTMAHTFMMHDPQFDIKLITISHGNISVDNATRNMCHLLDIYNKDIPVVKGYSKRIGDSKEEAVFLHTEDGLGGYIPPKTTKHQPLNVDAADAIYEVLKANPNEIIMVILGPHTTFANLMIKHPDAKDLIKSVVMAGGAPFGTKGDPNHNSFNIRTDAPSFQYTIDSKLPIIMVPSSVGRDFAHLTEEQVEEFGKINDVGKLLNLAFQTYWEPEYPDRRIATVDTSAVYYITHPKLYKMKSADIELNTETGKTTAIFNRKGQFKIAIELKRKKYIKMLFKKLHEMDDIKIPDLDNQDELRRKAEEEKNKTNTRKTTKSGKTTTQKATKTAKSTNKPSTKTTTAKSTSKATSKTTSKSTAKSTSKNTSKSTKTIKKNN